MNGREDFELFVAGRSTVLLRTVYLLCAGDRGAAEDMLQDVLERMYPKWRRINGNPEAYADPGRSGRRQGVRRRGLAHPGKRAAARTHGR